MGWNDHVDFELHEAIEMLVEEGYLEEKTPAYGIAQQVIHQGYESLSDKQRWVYNSVVVKALEDYEFDRDVAHAVQSDDY